MAGTTDTADLARGLAETLRAYLAAGCPCRYPRFVALAGRELPAGVGDFAQQSLIFQFDQAIPLVDKRGGGPAWEGRCSRCGSRVQRWAEELAMSSWLDHLRITPATGLDPLGAPLATPVPRCGGFFAASSGVSRRRVADAEAAYPWLPEAAWFAWLRARC